MSKPESSVLKQLISESNKKLSFSFGIDELIPTDIYLFDKITGGGIPRKKFTYIVGHEGSGKTTLAAQILASFQKKGFECVYLDSEYALSKQRMIELGVDYENCSHERIETIEQIDLYLEEIFQFKELKKLKKPVLVLHDSLASAKSQKTLESNLGDAQVGVEARLYSKFFRNIVGKLEKYDVTLIGINQYRKNIKINQFTKTVDTLKLGTEWALPCGAAPKYYAYLMVTMEALGVYDFITTEDDSNKKKEIGVGRIVKLQTIKNKALNPLIVGNMALLYKYGFSDVHTMIHNMDKSKMFTATGGRKGLRLLEGYNDTFSMKNFEELFAKNVGFRIACMSKYMEVVGDILEPTSVKIEDYKLSDINLNELIEEKIPEKVLELDDGEKSKDNSG